MLSASAIKELESKGFDILMPSKSKEELFKEIIEENNPRLDLAIPLILEDNTFDYSILNKYNSKRMRKILAISKEIISNNKLNAYLKDKKVESYSEEELNYFKENYLQFKQKKEAKEKLQLDIRRKMQLNKNIAQIFSPGKIRILKKIQKHEALTNTELKYYYRSIKPLLRILEDDNLRDYAKTLNSIKPLKE